MEKNNINIDNIISSNLNNVTDFLGNTWYFECMGCAMGNNELDIPGGIIYERDGVYVCQDPAIPIIGFLTINIRKHIKSIIDLTEEERKLIDKVLVMTIKALKELHITDEVSIVQEERAPHFHIWIFPNHDWMDEKFGKGTHYFRDIMKYAKENATVDDKKKILDSVSELRKYLDVNYE